MVHRRTVGWEGCQGLGKLLRILRNNTRHHPFRALRRRFVVVGDIMTDHGDVVAARMGNKMGRSSSWARVSGSGSSRSYVVVVKANEILNMFDIHPSVGTYLLKAILANSDMTVE